jgi:hypothetical protein
VTALTGNFLIQTLNHLRSFSASLSVEFKGIVSRDFVVCILVSFDRSEVPTHTKSLRLPLRFRLHVEFFDLRVSA